jgi:hypothetical protein
MVDRWTSPKVYNSKPAADNRKKQSASDSSKTRKVTETNQSLVTDQFSTDEFSNREAQAPKDARVSRGGKMR